MRSFIGGDNIDTIFLGKIAEQKKNKHLISADLSKLTGFKKSTINSFIGGSRPSERVAKAIASVLDIEM